MNMIDFCTGQLFDWFVSGNTAFTLIERLPTSVTQNTSDPACAVNYAGPNEMYTQIIKEVPIFPALRIRSRFDTRAHRRHHSSSTSWTGSSSRRSGTSACRSTCRAWITGYSPTIPGATGENLRSKINAFTIGHGTFSLLDAFPYQWGWFDVCTSGSLDQLTTAACGLSASIPPSERLFGQGVRAHFDTFTVTTSTG